MSSNAVAPPKAATVTKEAEPGSGRPDVRRIVAGFWMAGCLLMALAILFPVRFDSLRVAMAAGTLVLWAGALYLAWRMILVRIALLALGVAAVMAFILPGHDVDSHALRSQYVRSLRGFSGVTYIWGGETRLGVDCSGLVRCSMVDACYARAIHSGNAALFRSGLRLWWNDCSAKALGEGYRGNTREVLMASSLNALDHRRIQPGDLAVTESGLHVMAYLGDRTWIEADPKDGRVIKVRAPSADNVWFETPMRIVRWRILEGAALN